MSIERIFEKIDRIVTTLHCVMEKINHTVYYLLFRDPSCLPCTVCLNSVIITPLHYFRRTWLQALKKCLKLCMKSTTSTTSILAKSRCNSLSMQYVYVDALAPYNTRPSLDMISHWKCSLCLSFLMKLNWEKLTHWPLVTPYDIVYHGKWLVVWWHQPITRTGVD